MFHITIITVDAQGQREERLSVDQKGFPIGWCPMRAGLWETREEAESIAECLRNLGWTDVIVSEAKP